MTLMLVPEPFATEIVDLRERIAELENFINKIILVDKNFASDFVVASRVGELADEARALLEVKS